MKARTIRLLVRSPLAWIVLVAGIIRVVGIGWGLPASDGWDNDGVAPRDFLAGLVETFTPGHYYTYPPVHLLLLAILTAPITIVALSRAASLAPNDVIAEIIKVPYMTANSYVARVVSVVMSLGIVVLVARLASDIRSLDGAREDDAKRAGACAAAFAAANLSLTYYAHTTNLDVPYLFWGLWSLSELMRAMCRNEPRRLRRALVLAVLSVGTKDQAFALFVLTVPLALVATYATHAREERRAALRQIAIAVAMAAGLFLVADAVVFNPTGFRARLAFLAGSASKDFITYSNDWAGRGRMLVDVAKTFDNYYPLSLTLLTLAGIWVAIRRAGGQRRNLAVALFPFVALVSFTVFFGFTALRADHRFYLPQSLLLAVYGGLAIEPLVFALSKPIRILSQAYLSLCFAFAIYGCLAVDAQLLDDPRYEAEAWLEDAIREGELIETYGNNVYLPRFPAKARVIRVGPEPLDKRNPLPGVVEVQAPFGGASERRARFIVLPGGWMWRYLIDPNPALEVGQVVPPTHKTTSMDPEGTRFFARLTRSMDEYQVVRGFKYRPYFFPRLDIHASTSREVWIYERKSGR